MKKTMDEYGRLGRKSQSDVFREKYPFDDFIREECNCSVDELDKEDLDFYMGAYENFIGVKVLESRNKYNTRYVGK